MWIAESARRKALSPLEGERVGRGECSSTAFSAASTKTVS
jgi:hypothetical protein